MTDEIIEELWKIKDELAREANYDVHVLCQKLREKRSVHSPPSLTARPALQQSALKAKGPRNPIADRHVEYRLESCAKSDHFSWCNGRMADSRVQLEVEDSVKPAG